MICEFLKNCQTFRNMMKTVFGFCLSYNRIILEVLPPLRDMFAKLAFVYKLQKEGQRLT